MNDMAFGAGPERRRVPAQIFGHLLGRNDRTVGRMARDMRRPVANDLLSHGGPQAIGTDERRSRDALARGQASGDALAILAIVLDLAAHAQIDPRIRDSRLDVGIGREMPDFRNRTKIRMRVETGPEGVEIG